MSSKPSAEVKKFMKSGTQYEKRITTLNEVQAWQEECQKQRDDKQAASLEKAKARRRKLRKDAQDVRTRRAGQPLSDWTQADLKAIIQYKKKKGDPAMAKTLDGLIVQYEQRKDNPSPPCSDSEDDGGMDVEGGGDGEYEMVAM